MSKSLTVDWGSTKNGHAYSVGVLTSTLFHLGKNSQSAVNLYGKAGTQYLSNLYRDSNGLYKEKIIDFIGLGMRLSALEEVNSNNIIPYFNLGAIMAQTSSDISNSASRWGMELGIGADFLYFNKSNASRSEADGAFFIQFDSVHFANAVAEKIPMQPDILNGIVPKIGFRINYN